MIKFENVSKQFKTDFWAKPFLALNGVSFHVGAGELVGFLGANGAGKTTAIKIIMQFIRQTDGGVVYGPQFVKDQNSIFSNVGFLPERPYFYPHLSGGEFLNYMGELNGVEARVRKSEIDRWTKRFQLDRFLDRKLGKYSKGMLQRLGFISCLLHCPDVLILDEPLSGLDPIGRKEIKDILVELNNDGKTIFFSSHIVSDVEQICQKVIVLEDGKFVYQGQIDTLIEKNMTPDYNIVVQAGSGNVDKFKISGDQKDETLKKILNEGGRIISVGQNRPTLEQIVYNIRRQ